MTETLPPELDPKAATQVYVELRRDGPLPVPDLYDRLDCQPRTIRQAVADLVDAGLARTYHQPDDPQQRVVTLVETF